jgi:hypothetical protein
MSAAFCRHLSLFLIPCLLADPCYAVASSFAANPISTYPSPRILSDHAVENTVYARQALVLGLSNYLKAFNPLAKIREVQIVLRTRVIDVPRAEEEASWNPNFAYWHENRLPAELRWRLVGAQIIRLVTVWGPIFARVANAIMSGVPGGLMAHMFGDYWEARVQRPANRMTHGLWNLLSPVPLELPRYDAARLAVVSRPSLSRFYLGDAHANELNAKLPSPESRQNTFVFGGVRFTKVLRGRYVLWAFEPTEANLTSLAKVMPWKRRDARPLPSLGKNQVAASGMTLDRFFMGGIQKLARESKQKLPSLESVDRQAMFGGVPLVKVRTGVHREWAFEPTERNLANLAKATGWRRRAAVSFPKMAEWQLPVSSTGGLKLFFVGDMAELIKELIAKLPPVTSEVRRHVFAAIPFVKVMNGPKLVWAFDLTERNIFRLSDVMGWELRTGDEYPDIRQNQAAVSIPGLRPYFEGVSIELVNALESHLGPRKGAERKATFAGVKFEKVQAGTARVWAFETTEDNLRKISKAMKWQRKQDPLELVENLGLEEAVALLGGDPLRLKQYVQLVHPELLPDEIDRMVIRATSIPGMRADRRDILLEHQRYKVSYEPPELRLEKGETSGKLYVRGQVTPGTPSVQITGGLQQQLVPDKSGRFEWAIPEDAETYSVYSVNTVDQRRSRVATLPVEKQHFYTETLKAPEVRIDAPNGKTPAHVVKMQGTAAPGSAYVQVTGAFTRKIKVRSNRKFTAMLMVPRTGELNVYACYAVNDQNRQISPVRTISIEQMGEVELPDVVFRRLLAEREDILKTVKKQKGRYHFLQNTLEQSLLRYFTYDEADGFAYLQKKIREESSPSIREILQVVEQEFKEIASIGFKFKPGQKLYFFQKYTVYKAQRMLDEPDPVTGERAEGFLIANEQGLGKTVTALVFVNGHEALIITPNSVVSTWSEQEDKFIAKPNLGVLEGSHREREEILKQIERPQVVTNIEFTQGMTQKRADLLTRKAETLVIDEADYLGRLASQQSKGTRMIESRRRLLLSATPFTRIGQIGNLLGFMLPGDPRFRNARAFARAFPIDDPTALNALFLLLYRHSVRIRKSDVFEEFDPKRPLSEQSDRLPRKREIAPEERGQYTLRPEQADSIRQLLTDYQGWCAIHRRKISQKKTSATTEDKRYKHFKEGFFPKLQALRQIMNDPAYIGRPDLDSPKHKKMDEIIRQELENPENPGGKVIIFCKYVAEVKEYLRRYKKYGAIGYYGELLSNRDGYKIDAKGNLEYYIVDAYENPILKKGRPIPTTRAAGGRPIRTLDFQKILFQNDPTARILAATYETGTVGITLTAAHAVVYDDLASTYRDQYQAGDRAHRIDDSRKKYEVRYYWLQALYPQAFLKSLPQAIYARYFEMGTYDQVQYENLKNQGRIFHRIMDLLGDESELMAIHRHFLLSRMPFLFEGAGGSKEELDINVQETNGEKPSEDMRGRSSKISRPRALLISG